jgi:hypothetical protein
MRSVLPFSRNRREKTSQERLEPVQKAEGRLDVKSCLLHLVDPCRRVKVRAVPVAGEYGTKGKLTPTPRKARGEQTYS